VSARDRQLASREAPRLDQDAPRAARKGDHSPRKSPRSARGRGTAFAYRDATTMDDMPFDFSRYLASRLGVTEDETNAILAAWLMEYEPLAEAVALRHDPDPEERPAMANCDNASGAYRAQF
jgi:hypothetical protein